MTKKTGRKGKYEYWISPDGLLLIEGWARDGLTKEQIAKNIGINVKTLWDWERAHPPICNALKKGREVVDREVENALLKKARGYSYDEVKDEYEGGILVKRTVIKKMVLPDTTAQIFWLKNRKPNEYRDKHDIEVSKPNDETIKEMETYFGKLRAKEKASS